MNAVTIQTVTTATHFFWPDIVLARRVMKHRPYDVAGLHPLPSKVIQGLFHATQPPQLHEKTQTILICHSGPSQSACLDVYSGFNDNIINILCETAVFIVVSV